MQLLGQHRNQTSVTGRRAWIPANIVTPQCTNRTRRLGRHTVGRGKQNYARRVTLATSQVRIIWICQSLEHNYCFISRFHAYFPNANSFPSILADMLSDAIGCVGFSWASCPALTELETIVMDWFGERKKLFWSEISWRAPRSWHTS